MTHIVNCVKLGKQAEGLASPPYPGKLGEKIFSHVSAQAWQMWLNQQTMLINEYRLNALDNKAREFLAEEMEKFFFGEGSEKPGGYTPPQT